MEKAVLFPGCLILYRFPEYEVSARNVLKHLGYEVKNLPQTLCCGSYLEGLHPQWYVFTAYNLALAEQAGGPMITLCGGCTNTLKRVQNLLRLDSDLKVKVNKKLRPYQLEIKENSVEIKHIIQVLTEHQSLVKDQIVRPLSCKIAAVHPCQAFRPGSLMNFDDPMKPLSLRTLITLIGANPVEYPMEYDCCGSSLYLNEPNSGLLLGKQRIEEVRKSGADLLLTACGNCHLLLNRLQSKYNPDSQLPVLFLTQLIGAALGLDSSEIQLPLRKMKGWFERC